MKQELDVIIIGGGLAGLTAANYLAKGGKSVHVFEKSKNPGGRAITNHDNGYRMNLGPHALYKRGEAYKILQELGIPFSGQTPSGKYSYALKNDTLRRIPYTPASLLKTDLLTSWKAKLELLRFFAKLSKIETETLRSVTLHDWLQRFFRQQEVRDFANMFIRVATYTNDARRLSAGAAIKQLQIAFTGNVLYLDGGWQTLVHGLRKSAEETGVTISTQHKVVSIDFDSAVRGVRVSSGEYFAARNVVVATGIDEVAEIMGSHEGIRKLTQELVPVRMAALTVGLKQLPKPERLVAFGMDQPLYLSVHSKWAKLTYSERSALIHTGKYLTPGKKSDPAVDRKELEHLLDLAQPGWREEVQAYSYLPDIKVSNSIVSADSGGKRLPSDVAGIEGLHFCGDWIGDRGMLADASLISAKSAAESILERQAPGWNRESFEIVRSA